MSVAVHAPVRSWARIHRSVLIIIVLSMALAAALGLLAVTLVNRAVPAPTTSSVPGPLEPTDNGCQVAQPGQPC